MIPAQGEQHGNWRKVLLVCILVYEAASCLFGGSMLIMAPDGNYFQMPVSVMHGTFRDYTVPGIVLFLLGVLNVTALVIIIRKSRFAWFYNGLAMGGLLIWFWIEMAIIEQINWLQAVWGIPVIIGAWLAVAVYASREAVLKFALISGILSSILYASINVIVPLQWPEFNSATQTVSELSAVNAPTRMLWLVLSTPYTILVTMFAWGVWKCGVGNRPLRIAGVLLIAYGALGLLWPFAPMHLRETLAAGGSTISDQMHLTLGAVTEVIYFVSLWLVAYSLGKKFRIYSIATFFALMVFGVLTFLESPNVARNLPTPYIGIWERINIGLFLLWVIVLSLELLRREKLKDTTEAKLI